jgi:hypothetical protein
MGVGKWRLFRRYFRAYSSDAYSDTIRAVEHLASTSILLLEGQPEEERGEILAKAQTLTDKLCSAVGDESPMVGALALLTTVRVLERLVQEQANTRQK